MLKQSLFSESYAKEITLSKIDNLNLFYVACTRAEEHLYVFTEKIAEDKQGGSKMSDFISATLLADESWQQLMNEKNGNVFELGKCSPPLRKVRKEDAGSAVLSKWISVPWHERIGIAVNRKKVLSTDPEIADTGYGLLFHDLASGLNSKMDTRLLIDEYFISKQLPDETTIQKLKQDLDTFIQIAEERNWFRSDAETLTETEMLLQDGSIMRPDRIIISDEEVIVIDYKTGAAEDKHEIQVRQYAGVLKEMGYQQIKMYLVYPSENRVTEVSAA
jgi:ATP-dependent exoDNAse (exonuclease V) beta subunit